LNKILSRGECDEETAAAPAVFRASVVCAASVVAAMHSRIASGVKWDFMIKIMSAAKRRDDLRVVRDRRRVLISPEDELGFEATEVAASPQQKK
jgi:hypothetical protein